VQRSHDTASRQPSEGSEPPVSESSIKESSNQSSNQMMREAPSRHMKLQTCVQIVEVTFAITAKGNV